MTDCKWRNHEFGWVQGTIDSHGSIDAKITKEIEMHVSHVGTRWRWHIHTQEFMNLPPYHIKIEPEDINIILDWLLKKKLIDPVRYEEEWRYE